MLCDMAVNINIISLGKSCTMLKYSKGYWLSNLYFSALISITLFAYRETLPYNISLMLQPVLLYIYLDIFGLQYNKACIKFLMCLFFLNSFAQGQLALYRYIEHLTNNITWLETQTYKDIHYSCYSNAIQKESTLTNTYLDNISQRHS